MNNIGLPGEKEYEANRKSFVGGYYAYTIMKQNPFTSRQELLEELAGLIVREDTPSAYKDFGITWEPVIRAIVSKKLGAQYVEHSFKVENEGTPYNVRGALDGYNPNAEIQALEIKTASSLGCKEYYYSQLQFYMHFKGLKTGAVIVARRRPGVEESNTPAKIANFMSVFEDIKMYKFEYNKEYVKKMLEEIYRFYEDVERLKECGSISKYMGYSQSEVDYIHSTFTSTLSSKEELAKVKTDLLDRMLKYDIQTFRNWELVVSLVNPKPKKEVDVTKLSEDEVNKYTIDEMVEVEVNVELLKGLYPEIYEEVCTEKFDRSFDSDSYLKVIPFGEAIVEKPSTRKPHLRIKINKTE